MKKIIYYIIVILFATLSIHPLLMHPNKVGTDTLFHLANINDIVSEISLQNPFPKISANIGDGLGYSTHLFYAPLPHYVAAYAHLVLMNLGFEVWNTLIFIYWIVAISSGIIIFELSSSISKNKNVALVSSIIFSLLPYRVGEFCSISSMSQVFVSIFFPMILLSLNRMTENKRFLHLFVIGFSGMILSHLVLSMYACIFLLLWGILHFKQIIKKDILAKMAFGVLSVSIIVLPFITLTLSQKFGANISMYNDTSMWWLEYDYIEPNKLLIPTAPEFGIDVSKYGLEKEDYNWSVPQYINIVVILSFFISLIMLLVKKKINKITLYYILLSIMCLILFSKHFPWKLLPSIFYKVQFQRRFFVFLDIALSVLAPLWLAYLKPKNSKIISIVIIILLVITSIPLFKSVSNKNYLVNEIAYSNGTGWHNDYYPLNSVANMDYIKNRENKIKCNTNYINSSVIYSKPEKLIFEINSIYEENTIELPRFFYVGYELRNSKNETIDFYENKYGLIEFNGSNETYTLIYKGPMIYRIFVIIRYIFIIGFILFFLHNKFLNKKQNI